MNHFKSKKESVLLIALLFAFTVLLSVIILVACSGQINTTSNTETVQKKPVSSSVIKADPAVLGGDHEFEIMFINTGKSDSILIMIDGYNYLVDTGTEDAVPAILRALNLFGIEKLDAVFVTHTHDDHLGGLKTLGLTFPIDQVYCAEISELKKNGDHKIAAAAEKINIPCVFLHAGDTVAASGDAVFEVLGPIKLNTADDNDNSLVMRLSANGRTVLLTGDMQTAEENTLFSAGVNVKADILKVANHGNPDATSIRFGNECAPLVAVITTDTRVDTNSANTRVIAALGEADVYVTENYAAGVLVTVEKSGDITVSSPEVPKKETAGLKISSVDIGSQSVTLKNTSDASIDLSGYILYSEKGSEVFRFPAGSIIESDSELTVVCEGGSGDYIWPDAKVWHETKADAAVLYDKWGNQLDYFG